MIGPARAGWVGAWLLLAGAATAAAAPGDSRRTAVTVAVPGAHTQTLRAGRAYWMRVVLRAPGVYVASAEAETFEASLTLLDAAGTALRDRRADGAHPAVLATELQPGTYYLRVEGGAGEVRCHMGRPGRLLPGITRRARLLQGRDSWWQVEVETAGPFQGVVEGAEFTPELLVVDRYGAVLERAPGTAQATRANVELEEGVHYLRVRGVNPASQGAFHLRLGAPPAGTRSEHPVDMAFATHAGGRLRPGTTHWVRFRVDRPTPARLDTRGSDFDTVLALYDARRRPLAENDDANETERTSRIERLLEPGTYLLEVRAFDDDTGGTFRVNLRPGESAQSRSLPLEVGQVRRGRLELNQRQWFRVDVPIAGRYTFDTNGSAFDTVLRLYDERERELAEDDDGGQQYCSQITSDLQTGSYYLEVRGYSANASGGYQVSAQGGPTDVDGTILTGRDFEAQIEILQGDRRNFRTFRLEVGRDVQSVVLTLVGRGPGDLYAKFGAQMARWESADHTADGPGPNERIVIDRGGSPPLRSGVYYLDVANRQRTEVDLRAVLRVAFTVREQRPLPTLTGIQPAEIVLADEPVQVRLQGSDLRPTDRFWVGGRRVRADVTPQGAAAVLSIPHVFPQGEHAIHVETEDGERVDAPTRLRVERDPFEEYEFGELTWRSIPTGRAQLGQSSEGPGAIQGKDDPQADPSQEVRRDYDQPSGWFMCTTEVTQAAYLAVLRQNPSIRRGARIPVNNVTFAQAQAYCQALNRRAQTDPRWSRYEFRLPTEDEWEYVCRAGTQTPIAVESSPTNRRPFANRLARLAWFQSHTPDDEVQGPFAPAQLEANPWGFYDLHGNVGEWCLPSPDLPAPPADHAPFRGGSWTSEYRGCRASQRDLLPADFASASTGFRVIAVPR